MIVGVQIGIAFAFVAMLCWGFGDFFIQKSTRKLGDIETLFFVTLIGVIILLPFVITRLPEFLNFSNTQVVVLGIAAITILLASILDFEALKLGKLSIVEPTFSLEIPTAAFLAFFILGETISFNQIVLIVILVASLGLVSYRGGTISTRILLEKGFWYALATALVMGGSNFFIGVGGRVTDPIMVNFVVDVFMMTVTGLMLVARGRFMNTFKDFRKNMSIALTMGIADKVAWVAFTFSMVLAPIAVAVALSESYIIVAVIFGLFVNREKIKRHQFLGLFFAIAAAIILAVITQ